MTYKIDGEILAKSNGVLQESQYLKTYLYAILFGKKMNTELVLFARNKENIWTNKWISKNMLAAHLDFNNDAASRNISVINKTIDWITGVIKKKSTLLDLGCGPGLYAEALTKKGFKVVGLDISKRSIKYAKKSAKDNNLKITYYNQNYLIDDIKNSFDSVMCIYCDFGALIPSEQVVLLKKIHSVLNTDGLFIFDVFTEGLSSAKKEGKQWNYHKKSSFWCKKPHFVLEETAHFPDNNAWGTRSIVINKKIKKIQEYITWDTYYSKEHISALLQKNGFKVEGIATEIVEKNSFTSNSVMFIVAKKI